MEEKTENTDIWIYTCGGKDYILGIPENGTVQGKCGDCAEEFQISGFRSVKRRRAGGTEEEVSPFVWLSETGAFGCGNEWAANSHILMAAMSVSCSAVQAAFAFAGFPVNYWNIPLAAGGFVCAYVCLRQHRKKTGILCAAAAAAAAVYCAVCALI